VPLTLEEIDNLYNSSGLRPPNHVSNFKSDSTELSKRTYFRWRDMIDTTEIGSIITVACNSNFFGGVLKALYFNCNGEFNSFKLTIEGDFERMDRDNLWHKKDLHLK
jgi:hypothetical protein